MCDWLGKWFFIGGGCKMCYYLRNVIVVFVMKCFRWGLSVVLYYTGLFSFVSYLSAKLIRPNRALILRYHQILADEAKSIYDFGLPATAFARQIEFLARHYHVVAVDELINTLRSSGKFIPRTVAITFDDGYRDNFKNAIPLLKQYALPATFFITAGFLNHPHQLPWWHRLAQAVENYSDPMIRLNSNSHQQCYSIMHSWQKQQLLDELLRWLKHLPHDQFISEYQNLLAQFVRSSGSHLSRQWMLTWDEAQALKSHGFQIGGHTLTHPILTRLTPVARELELCESKRIIEEKLQTKVELFAFPNGTVHDVDLLISQQLSRCGYRAAFTSVGGFVRPNDNLYLLKRKGVYRGTCTNPWGRFSPALFTLELSGFYDWLLRRKGSPHG